MGSLIGNKKFSQGFDEFAIGKNTKDAFIWKALSAASEELG